MTVHIGFSNDEGAILLSDSQGSTTDAETHGNQKQFVGDNFIVGGAGHNGIIDRLFRFLDEQSNLPSANAPSVIEDFFETQIRREQFGRTTVLLLIPGDPPFPNRKIRVFDPGTYAHFDEPSKCCAIGSGGPFVGRAWKHRNDLGIQFPSETLADLTVEAVFCAEAANESLTVDDRLMVSFLYNGRAYTMGEPEMRLDYAPSEVKTKWREVAQKWSDIRQKSNEIINEFREAARLFSGIRAGKLSAFHLNQFNSANQTIARRRSELETQLKDYFDWYDNLLKR